jgi:hypothetical protein
MRIFHSLNFFVALSILCVPFLGADRAQWKHNEHKVFSNEVLPLSDSTPLKQKTGKKIIPDDYPVTDAMLGRDVNQDAREIKSGDVYSIDKVWFRNDSLKQILVFELYTDQFRNMIFHFKTDDIPKELINTMELHTEDRDTANQKAKEKTFYGFTRLAKPLAKNYFRTNKGFKLDNSKDKAIKMYGKADKISKRDGVETYEWDYIGDSFYDAKKDIGKKIAVNSYGHQVIMFFRNNKLIGIIFHNDIP